MLRQKNFATTTTTTVVMEEYPGSSAKEKEKEQNNEKVVDDLTNKMKTEKFVQISEDQIPAFLEFLRTHQEQQEKNNNEGEKKFRFNELAVVGHGDGDPVIEGSEPIDSSLLASSVFQSWEQQLGQVRRERAKQWRDEKSKEKEDDDDDEQKKDEKLEFLDDWVMIGKEEEEETVDLMQSLSASWVCIPKVTPPPTQIVYIPVPVIVPVPAQPLAIQSHERPGFFDNWPSFGVYEKLGVVLKATGSAFIFGFVMGAKLALESLYRLMEQRPAVGVTAGIAATVACTMAPGIILTGIKYVMIGGIIGGAGMATPILILGTTGVFVGAGLYHLWQLSKRSVKRGVLGWD